jgi:hypothetical protein
MRSLIKAVLIAGAFAGASLAIPSSASARDSFSVYVHSGDVAFAYRDGWWDSRHNFHRWRDRDEMRWYRRHHRHDYRDWDHDRDSDNGWHDRGNWHDGDRRGGYHD